MGWTAESAQGASVHRGGGRTRGLFHRVGRRVGPLGSAPLASLEGRRGGVRAGLLDPRVAGVGVLLAVFVFRRRGSPGGELLVALVRPERQELVQEPPRSASDA